ncbi:F0F1 ATP synthase subunit A [Phenylobacterium hankyongense]|uniref:ATP synthase subunit a n=2 Tax=Phenylobacterium hankyongense TaxID=1813876 RepID=A0A328B2L9_9CAUL|nr:F0F1 ATP synthase subunit A [Phenylobacterium hankyongense]RAK60084.1 F0F1 ATP synthase subunit A [Phenylobacterium hankyongense]
MAEAPPIAPMEQFLVHPLVKIPPLHIGGLTLDMSITNATLAMAFAAFVACAFLFAAGKRQLVPGRLQSVGESLFDLIDQTLVGPIMGHSGRPYVPFIFTIFMLVLVMNMAGLLLAFGNLAHQEWTFTATAQLAVTLTLALISFLSVVAIGFIKNGLGFFKLFTPSGLPLPMLMLVAPLEFLSFMIRPVTLAMRLFGNMLGGHVVMYMFASFVVGLGLFALQGGIAYLAFAGSGVSFAMVVALTALEFIVAFLQAFVFAALTTVYLNDVVNLGHGH